MNLCLQSNIICCFLSYIASHLMDDLKQPALNYERDGILLNFCPWTPDYVIEWLVSILTEAHTNQYLYQQFHNTYRPQKGKLYVLLFMKVICHEDVWDASISHDGISYMNCWFDKNKIIHSKGDKLNVNNKKYLNAEI